MAFTRHRVHNTLDPVRVKTDGSKAAADADPAEERLRARVKQNTAYEKYKASLHEFFDGNKPLPDNLRALLATRPGAQEHLGEAAEEPPPVVDAALADKKDKKKKKGEAAGKAGKKERNGERLARRMVSADDDSYGVLVDEVRRASSPREVEGAIDALRAAGYPLPHDGEILSKALGHKDEAVIGDALRGLLEVAAAGGIKSPRLLRTRIDNVALLATSGEVKSLCQELKTKLV